MTFGHMIAIAGLAAGFAAVAGADTVIVNEQTNVVNEVKGGGQANSGVDLGGRRRSVPAAAKADPGTPEDIEAEIAAEKQVIVNKKTNVVNRVDGQGRANSGVKLKKAPAKPKKAVVDPIPAGNGKTVTAERKVTAFTGVYISGAFRVKVVCGAATGSVRLTGDSNLLELIRTEVVNRRLDIAASRSYRSAAPITVEIAVPRLSGLWLEGAVRETVENVDGEQIVCEVSGSSSLAVSGNVMMLRATVDGASSLDAAGLAAIRVDLHAEGASRALVRPGDRLKVTAGGASKIYYLGKTVTLFRSLSGAAAVKLINEDEVKKVLTGS